mgnify:CR=1 FL=1
MNRLVVLAIVAVALVGCSRQEAPVDNSASYVDPGYTEIRTGITNVRMYQVVNMENRSVCTIVTRGPYRDDAVAVDCLPYYHEGSTPSGMQVDGE